MKWEPLSPAREASLLDRLRSGDRRGREQAAAELFGAFHGPLHALCTQLVGRRGDAEDVVQDVLLSVHRALDQFRGDSTLATWVYRIAIRAAIQHRARRASTETLDTEGLTVPDPAPSLDAVAAARQDSARVIRALGRLSSEHRAVLSLFAVDGLMHGEIAAVLGIPEGTVWSRLHLARKRLLLALDSPEPRLPGS
jgi:RNA polymerase sigma-70 factor (ECF subfamily)